MREHCRTISAAILFVASATVSADTPEVHFPVPSTWEMDLSASQLPGPPAMKTVTLVFTADTATLLTYQEKTLLIDGKVLNTSYSYPEDGKMHPITGGNGLRRAVWPDGHFEQQTPSGAKMDAHWSIAGDQATETGTLKLPDGRSLAFRYVYHRVTG